MSGKRMDQVLIRLDEEERKRLDQQCREKGLSRSSLIARELGLSERDLDKRSKCRIK